jgi:DNA invertase Pin-like site-specific DNA recombinase
MSDTNPTLVAQYLRMSTERQEYSLHNQSQAIAKYAEEHGFVVGHTYSDPAISGVLLRRRKGLRKLIEDVVKGHAHYKAILVYDVSRWGRFQDTDEGAYYEYLCKSAGVRVHYCAETFSNDDAWPNMIMKTLKRVMAGEYSRELGVKVFAAQKRGALLGFRQGSLPGYGLRRLLVSAERKPKQILKLGERKGLATDRVILIPGPSQEVRCVKEIYRLFIVEGLYFTDIARELNRRGTQYIGDMEWTPRAVQTVLTHPKYIGCNVYGRSTQRLETPIKQQPTSEWTITPGAFEPVIDATTFARAQLVVEQTRNNLPRNKSDKELLDALRAILSKHGRIDIHLIKKSSTTPSEGVYKYRFGNLSHAYELIGYKGFWSDGWMGKRRRIQALRHSILKQIVDLDPAHFSIEKRGGRQRTRLQMNDGRFISVIAARPFRGYKGALRWLLKPVEDECHLVSLVARLNENCDAFTDMFVTPPIGKSTGIQISESDPWLQKGIRLRGFTKLSRKVETISTNSSGGLQRIQTPRTKGILQQGQHQPENGQSRKMLQSG